MSFFDHFASPSTTRVGDWITARLNGKLAHLITEFVTDRNCAILEIGPGKGELASLLIKSGYGNYAVVEPNDTMRSDLLANGIAARGYHVPPLLEPDSSYDLIILSAVFEHLNGTLEAQSFVDEARRVLRNGGMLCLFCPDYLHWRHDFFDSDYSHSNITTVRRTTQILHNNGFQVLRQVYFSGPLTGSLAPVGSHIARFALDWVDSNGLDNKLYKLKLTFLRCFFIVASKVN